MRRRANEQPAHPLQPSQEEDDIIVHSPPPSLHNGPSNNSNQIPLADHDDPEDHNDDESARLIPIPKKKRFASFELSIRYVYNDTIRKKRAFLIGLFTVILVVLIIALLRNAVDKSPLVFLRLSETSVGEMDLMYTALPSNVSINPFINSTRVAELLQDNPYVNGTVPRWILPATVFNTENPSTGNTSVIILVVDTRKEARLRIGRGWPHRVLGQDEAHVSNSILRQIGVQPQEGQRITMNINLVKVAQSYGAVPSDPQPFVRSVLTAAGFNITGNTQINTTAVLQALGIATGPFPLPPTNIDNSVLFDQLYPQLLNAFNIFTPFTVVDNIGSTLGKYPSALGNVVLVDSKYFLRSISAAISAAATPANPLQAFILAQAGFNAQQNVSNAINAIRIDDFALTSVVQLKDRETTYLKDSADIDSDLITYTNSIQEKLGYNTTLTLTTPIVAALKGLSFIRLFLDQLFAAIIALIIFLGSLLIFSLLLSNVEERTYEYGMLRALGLRNSNLMQVIISQAVAFSIPGIGIGLFLAFLFYIPVEDLIASFAYVKANYNIAVGAAVTAAVIGFAVPLLTNIVPIRRALSKTLRDSLDIYHQVWNETHVQMIKLEELGLQPWQTAIALVLIAIGIIVYYLIPYAFTFGNLPLFFSLLNIILASLIVGLCMISTTIQAPVERFLLKFLLWGSDLRLENLIRKNLAAHRNRSRKTFIMFMISVAFIVFAGVQFSLQANSFVENIQQFVGSDVVASTQNPLKPLATGPMISTLESLKQQQANGNPGYVTDYAFATFPLNQVAPVQRTFISNLASFPFIRVLTYGVTSSYLRSTYSQYFLPTEYDESLSYRSLSNDKPDVIGSLYSEAGRASFPNFGTPAGYTPSLILTSFISSDAANASIYSSSYTNYMDLIVSEGTKTFASIDTKTPIALWYRALANGQTAFGQYLAKARAQVYKFPGFFYSSYQSFAFNSPVLVAIDKYQQILNDATSAVSPTLSLPRPIPYARCFVRLRDDLTESQREDFLNTFLNAIDSDSVDVQDVRDVVTQTKVASSLIIVFFNLVSVITVILCFFILWLSFTANVKENSWEFGVLRSLGLSVTKLIRAYIYEALCLILSAFLLGTIIGLLVGLTLVVQFNLFLELPFQFDFPYALFFPILAMSFVLAILGSYLPARQLRAQEIAQVLRGG